VIIDHLSNAGFYFGADPLLREALEFLRLPEIATLGMGRHSLRGDDLFALVSGGVTVAEVQATARIAQQAKETVFISLLPITAQVGQSNGPA